MSLALQLRAEPVRTLAFGAIAVGYMGVGTVLDHPSRMFLIQNLTDVGMMFSFDGVNDHFPLQSNSYFVLDISANQSNIQGFYLAQNERLYVKELTVAAGSGAVYFTSFYGNES